MKFSIRTLFVLVFAVAIGVLAWQAYVEWKYSFRFTDTSIEVTPFDNVSVTSDGSVSTVELIEGDVGVFELEISGKLLNRADAGQGGGVNAVGQLTRFGDKLNLKISGGLRTWGGDPDELYSVRSLHIVVSEVRQLTDSSCEVVVTITGENPIGDSVDKKSYMLHDDWEVIESVVLTHVIHYRLSDSYSNASENSVDELGVINHVK